ncbi:Fur family transcriptional regulator [Schaalia naturae]|uniref:Fur family transcriptional regulator n=1 Tax=Schaalia naturae TaxID=635203 RepID=A0ABW2SLI3_9ACTO
MSAAIRGRRNTVQKEAVRTALEEAAGFISAGRLHRRLNEEGSPVGLATVYRQLNALAESGYADTISGPGGQLFRACELDGHHHHLVCEACGKAVDIDPPDEEWISASADLHGFTVTRHVLEVFGRCAECSSR